MECHLQDWLAQRPWLPSTVSCLLSYLLSLREASLYVMSYSTERTAWQGIERERPPTNSQQVDLPPAKP